ncbi:MAG: GNAT family N-acetyltransferase [Dehalococcoidia bacterium]|nr:GNAT family N-acetyltransferase [Dehalococcoidia bacterium]
MTLEVRPAQESDEDAVFRLLPQLMPNGSDTPEARALFRKLCSGERGGALVAADNGSVIGVITYSFNLAVRFGGEYTQVEELVVDEAARGKRAGAALVEACIAAARGAPGREIGLYPLEGNRPFYEKFGFTYAGEELRQRLA